MRPVVAIHEATARQMEQAVDAVHPRIVMLLVEEIVFFKIVFVIVVPAIIVPTVVVAVVVVRSLVLEYPGRIHGDVFNDTFIPLLWHKIGTKTLIIASHTFRH